MGPDTFCPSLEEEAEADKKLADLAESTINEQAVGQRNGQHRGGGIVNQVKVAVVSAAGKVGDAVKTATVKMSKAIKGKHSRLRR